MSKKHYFLVGIGGISMSGIAKLLILQGNRVSGSDIQENEEIQKLEKMGADIIIGQKPENIVKDIDMVIFTSAANNPKSPGFQEIQKAKKLNIPIYKRSEFIGKLMKDKIGISISGMHGKTTITAMLGFVFKKLGLKPTVLLGGEFKEFSHQNLEFSDSNSKYFIVEACEYDRSFLDFKTKIALISNIEKEHLDYFKGGLSEIRNTFLQFLNQIPQDGFAVVYGDDQNVREVSEKANGEIIKYSARELPKTKIKLQIPGQHNLLNALACLKIIEKLGLDIEKAKKILSEFSGVHRRFEILGKINSTIFIDDYAHHPTEIEATLKACREFYGDKKTLVIFQPHQYSRTKLLLNDFAKSFKKADFVVICDVYEVAGREEDKSIGSKELVEKIKLENQKVLYLSKYSDVEKFLKTSFSDFGIIMSMGAGPVNQVLEKFIAQKRHNGN